ncbi:phage major capsid protein [Desulforhopalus singaporensis]|uniref:Mu-like prophage major head subunit gpT n=1 Tax=Desulforhopalus singaporensis TaxID=91360 RepID=A0A1H0UTZ3_9BACT|nr:hypothetical protein [Desulforhopalus singaporensis]SDP69654.1 hypothetical protein SAMN05660330_03714 [Desulforhopalus singaporensis]
MNPKLLAFLRENGLRADATEQEAWDYYDKLKEDGVDLPGIDPGQRAAAPANGAGNGEGNTTHAAAGNGGGEGRRTYSQEELEAIVEQRTVQAMGREATRRASVQELIDVAGVGDLDGGAFARSLLDNPDVSRERASDLIFTELKKRNVPIGTGAHVGTEAPEKLRAAITDGLLMRQGIPVAEPAAGARDFRGRSMIEICRELLEASGVNCRSMSRMDIAGRAIASTSTSDFANIFSSLVGRSLMRAYDEWPSTWRPFVAITGANDFRDIHAVKLSGAPDLQGISENGEYKTAIFSDAKESYRVITKGIRVPLTRTMIINDDLRAFTRVPQLFGVAARRMESAAVYSLINTNGAMSDGTALYHADHSNLAASGGALSSTTLGAGRAAMRKQTGLDGESIDVIPAFLLTPVALETTAEVLLRSTALPDDNKSAGVYNPWAGKLTPISDPLLDATSATAWYLFAHPNQVPVIEAAYLEGEEQPYVEEQVDFNSDALIIKVRHDFGAGVVDHPGTYKNAGA